MRAAGRLLPARLREPLKAAVMPRLVRRPAMAGETRSRLSEGFREDISELQEMIGQDLAHWLA